MAFNKKEYDKNFLKNNYKTFKVDLKKEEWEKADKLLKNKKITKVELVRIALKLLEEGKIKKEEQDK